MTTRPRILYLPLEFTTWKDAQYWSYPMGLGLEEGFAENQFPWLTIPAWFGSPTTTPTQWLSRLQNLCAGEQFDQVWFTANHLAFDDETLDLLSRLAPVRVGFFIESLVISAEEWKRNPTACKTREERTHRALRLVTHATVFDEDDAHLLAARGIPAMWWPGTTPRRFLCAAPGAQPPGAPAAPAVFLGALYGERAQWLAHPALQGLLIRPDHSLEHETALPDFFNALQEEVAAYLTVTRLEYPAAAIYSVKRASHGGAAPPLALWQKPADNLRAALDEYLGQLREVRANCFRLWLETLRRSAAVVNLPQFGWGFSGRVFETMAAGAPAIAHRIANRPRSQTLFEDDREILLYSTPEELAEHIRRLQRDAAFRLALLTRARECIAAHHTTGHRVAQCVRWLATGELPRYGQD